MAGNRQDGGETAGDTTRRDLLKRAGVGAAVAWTAPTILGTHAAAAATPGPVPVNLALDGTATMSSALGLPYVPPDDLVVNPGNGNDGDTSCDHAVGDAKIFHTGSGPNEWWQVDLGVSRTLTSLTLYNRCDAVPERAQNLTVQVDGITVLTVTATQPADPGYAGWVGAPYQASALFPPGTTGQVVRVTNGIDDYFHLAEVEVYGS